MLKYFRAALLIIFTLVFFRTDFASAATFYLEPASGDLIKGCLSTINLRLSTEGDSSNGAQAYVDYSSLGGGTISVIGGGIFSTYGTPPGVPAGTLGIYGYGGVVSGNGLGYAAIRVRSNANGPLTLTVHPNTADPASKIAEHPSSNDILTSVASGSYTVVDGYCETQPPYLTELNPVPDKPNHPVGQNILFDIRDDDSGVNISTLAVTVKQNNVDVPFNQTVTAHGTDNKWYSIVIDPTNDLTPELKVVVTVAVNDKAGNTMTRTYQFNDLTCSQLGCLAGGITPQCRDSVDNDGDGKIDFPADAGCSDADDNNEFISTDFVCEPEACAPASTTPGGEQGTGGGVTPQCADGIDNDGDGLIDSADPGCENSSDNNEYVFGEMQCPICVVSTTTAATTPATTEAPGLSIKNARFFLASRSVETVPNVSNVVETLRGLPLTVAIDIKKISGQISDARLILDDDSYRMFYDNGLKLYAVDVLNLVNAGTANGAIVIEHGTSTQETIPFTVSVLSKGKIIGKNDAKPIVGANVVLEQRSSAGKYVTVSTVKTDSSGEYGFVVPNGTYRLTIKADGFRDEQTTGFAVGNHIIDRDFSLITAINLLDANVSVADKAVYITEVAGEQAGKVLASANDPVVEQAVQQTVAPIALGSAVVATLPALSALNLLSYLRFLFLQPVFLFGRKKRKKWGVVYNALTKLPVDLAVVRLVDANNNRVVQSRVTDNAGRYAFFADPGLYRLEVAKQGFIFPTKIMQDFKEDTSYLDIYHGEAVHVDDRYVALTANIPLDPAVGAEKTPRRLIWEQRLRDLQRFIASFSIAAGLLSVIISPTWWTIGLLALQIALYYLFKRLGKAKKPKNWGIVYDAADKKPIGKAVARLFSKQFNKLVSTEVTDNSGRYAFMVGPNEYYITFEKTGYKKATSPGIAIKEKNELIKMDTALEKEDAAAGQPPAPTVHLTPSSGNPTGPVVKM